MNLVQLFAELQRRNVFRAATLYAASGWLLVQVATQVFPFFGIADTVVRLVVVAVLLGFPLVVVLSWLYEFTPDGFRRERRSETTPAFRHLTRKRLDMAIIAALTTAVVLLLADRWLPHQRAATGNGKSVAVLPLVNESADPAQDYFADGLSEELIAALAQIPDLKVISRTSSFRFRGSRDGAERIAARLGVATLLEGTVRQQDGRVRVVTSLINAVDNRVLWSHSYEREMRDIFALQNDIAQAVATSLKANFQGATGTSGDRPPGGSIDAYNALLQGRYYFYTVEGSAVDARRAIDEFTRATTIDPRYAVAFAMLSSAWTNLAGTYLSGEEASRAYEHARDAIDAALGLAPDLALAHIARGYLLSSADFDWQGAEAAFRHALELSPRDGAAKVGLANQLASLGRLDEAVGLTRSALETDPLHVNWYANLGGFLAALGRTDEADQAMRKALQLQPGGVDYYATLTLIDIQRGDLAAALDDAKRESSPVWRRYALALAHAALGRQPDADAALETLIRQDADSMAFQVAEVYAVRGEPDRVFAWLERAIANRDAGMAYLLQDPPLLRYRDDPRFAALCKRLDLPRATEAKPLALPVRPTASSSP